MTVTLVLPTPIPYELHAALSLDVETAGVLLARRVETPQGNVRLLGRTIRWIPDDAYETREFDSLSIRSHGYVPSLSVAAIDGAVPIWLHTHPGDGSSPEPSRRDAVVDGDLSDLFRLRSGSSFYGSVIISRDSQQLQFTGHLESDLGRSDIDRLMVSGSRLALARNWLHKSDPLPDQFDRSIRAFGGDIQRVLAALSVAIVGCGGTGSVIAEQLVRLGVRRFLLMDPDHLESSNITRVFGSSPSDIGRTKVDVLAKHLSRIAPGVQTATYRSMVTLKAAATALTDADVIFGCTDDNAGRLVLSRLATYMATPVIDCGVLLTSGSAGRLDGIHGRVTVMAPGLACLLCRGRIDVQRAAAEMLTPAERKRLADDGYAPALGNIEPAVVAYTTQVGAAAVGELLERLVHYGPEPVPSEVVLRIHDREVSTNIANPKAHHYCHPEAQKIGLGVTEPFLEQTWSE